VKIRSWSDDIFLANVYTAGSMYGPYIVDHNMRLLKNDASNCVSLIY